MSFVRTVLGDIAPEQLGVCYAHEHIIIDQCYATERNPDYLLDDVDKAVAELSQFQADGGRAMVDSMPCDCGRNVSKLAEVSRRTGVHIIAPTGLHLAKYYDPGHWGGFYSEEKLSDLFIQDIEVGIDAHDYNGPFVSRTAHRAGVIKVASGMDKLSDRETKAFRAAAKAHLATGCPILTHTEQGTAGLQQIELLGQAGVRLDHVVLSHTDRRDDVEYHRALLRTGVNLEYDAAFRWKPDQRNVTVELLIQLLPEFPHQLMLGMDAARRRYWTAYDGSPGLSYLLTQFRRQLEPAPPASPLTKDLLHCLYMENAARTLAFLGR